MSIFSISRKKTAKSASDFRIFYFKTAIFEKNIKFYRTKRKVPKVIYCLRYCFLLTKNCMHNEVWGYTEILPHHLLPLTLYAFFGLEYLVKIWDVFASIG